MLTFSSCEKDSDLFYEAVIEQEEEIEEQSGSEDENSGSDDTNNDGNNDDDGDGNSDGPPPPPEDPDFENTNKISGVYYPESAADISNPDYAEHKAVITNSFDCSGCTFSENQTIEPAGGVISGRNINLNGAFIETAYKPVFSTDVTFTQIYDRSRLTPENFGADGGDSAADDDALSTLIGQSQYALGQTGSRYIKNRETRHSRSGTFNWNMNGAFVRTTSSASLSHGSGTDNQHKYMFEFANMNVEITNGTFNGQNLASRAIYLNGITSYYFDNVVIQNYLSPGGAYARGTGLKIDISNNFAGGSFLNGVIENIGATSDNNANNSPFGVSKAISLNVGTNNASEQLIQNSRIENIYGDDAEGFYYRSKYGFGGYDHESNRANITFNNNEFIACQRRALKVNASNCQITNNYIESATNDWIFSGAQAALLHIFPLSPQRPLHNVNVIGNTIKTIGEARNPAFGITEAMNCRIENNVFEADHIMLQRNVAFGNGSNSAGSNSGFLDRSIIFRNNTITNYFVLLNKYMISSNGGMTFENNTINLDIDRGMGSSWGAFRKSYPSPMDLNDFTFKDITININQKVSTGGSFGGVLCSEDSDVFNTTFENVDINYTGNAGLPTYPFMIIGTNPGTSMNNSNRIVDCDVSGAVGTGSIGYTGSANPVITNSFGDGGTALTTRPN